MRRNAYSWMDEDEDLQVFVPGLMASGILVSIGMLVWDGIKRAFPNLGSRARSAALVSNASGRLDDLLAVERGEVPQAMRVERVRRNRVRSLALAMLAAIATALTTMTTVYAYGAEEGTLAGRGWTLSFGLGLATVFAVLSGLWLASALWGGREPQWLASAHTHWPIGVLPEPAQHDA